MFFCPHGTQIPMPVAELLAEQAPINPSHNLTLFLALLRTSFVLHRHEPDAAWRQCWVRIFIQYEKLVPVLHFRLQAAVIDGFRDKAADVIVHPPCLGQEDAAIRRDGGGSLQQVLQGPTIRIPRDAPLGSAAPAASGPPPARCSSRSLPWRPGSPAKPGRPRRQKDSPAAGPFLRAQKARPFPQSDQRTDRRPCCRRRPARSGRRTRSPDAPCPIF